MREAFYSYLKLFSHAGSFLFMLENFSHMWKLFSDAVGLTYSALENARVHHE